MGRPAAFYIKRLDPVRKIIWIIDESEESNTMTVTNDAENVVRQLLQRLPGHRIIYRDTMGNWDELTHCDGQFTGFKPARDMNPDTLPQGD